ncbi:DUF3097 family protein, partial [Streptomyces sp. NPDC049577]|uniref:DUF3097 family protein n=1 Tax=Streptomyces sp. NPDC049577 TaxID=3155153 RepID=UPI0034468D70
LGVLVDHLVPGSKESRIAASVTDEHVLDEGRVVARGTPAELLAGLAERRTVTVASAPGQVPGALARAWDGDFAAADCRRPEEGGLRFTTTGTAQLALALRVLAEHGCSGVSVAGPGLGDVYRAVIPDREFGVR